MGKKSKRSNYLIDKPFQIGFIAKYVIIILLTVVVTFCIAALYYFQDSLLGSKKLDSAVEYKKRGIITYKGGKVYSYEPEKIEVYESKDGDGNTVYRVYDPKQTKFAQNDIIEDIQLSYINDENIVYGPITHYTTRFHIVFFPLLWSNLALIIIITVYSLFFSHRMAGPIYRMRVSLDRMLTGDFKFKIRVRKSDFYINVVEKLEKLRDKIESGELPKK